MKLTKQKYQIGDLVLLSVELDALGEKVIHERKLYIVGVEVESTEEDIAYFYRLKTAFPVAYSDGGKCVAIVRESEIKLANP